MAGASGAQSQTRSSAAAAVAPRTSSDAGYDCQKFFTPTASPPDTSPANTSPLARRPAIASSQQLWGLVRFWIVNPSAVVCASLKSSHTAQSAMSFCPAALNVSLLALVLYAR